MPIEFANRTITQAAITQGAAGSTDIVAIPGVGLRIFVVSIYLVFDAAGTYKFTEGTGPTALTGVIPVGVNGVLSLVGSDLFPALQTNTANSKLTLTTVTAKAFGWFSYFVDNA